MAQRLISPANDSFIRSAAAFVDSNFADQVTTWCGFMTTASVRINRSLFNLPTADLRLLFFSLAEIEVNVTTASAEAVAFSCFALNPPAAINWTNLSWTNLDQGVPTAWTSPGGDVTGSGSTGLVMPIATGLARFDVTTALTQALAAFPVASHVGLLFKKDDEAAQNRFIFDSLEGTIPPKLFVTVPDGRRSLALLGVG